MGCFLGCFGSKKEQQRRRRKSPKRVLPRDHQRNGCVGPNLQLDIQRNACDEHVEPTVCLNKDLRNDSDEVVEPSICLKKDCTEEPSVPIVESREKVEEQLSLGTRKKVTFDLTVKAYEEVTIQEVKDYAREDEVDKEEKVTKQSQSSSLLEGDWRVTSLASYPSNHRYQNCSHSDDEYESGLEESDLEDEDDDYCDDDEDDHGIVQDESSESFFSLPSAVQQQGSKTPLDEKEVNSPLPTRDRSQYIHSVLNPIENLTQWKAVKMRSKPPLKQQKEKTALEKEVQIPFSSEPNFRLSPFGSSPRTKHSGPPKEYIAVDTSLSNWLGSSETTPSTKTSNLSIGIESAEGSMSQRSNSPRSHEDRPILGALTVEEIRQFSATSSPRKSPSRSPDEMPILGTVGSYWSHTGQASDSSSGSSYKGVPNTTSKYREDKRVNWHSTPFETRLERALSRGEP